MSASIIGKSSNNMSLANLLTIPQFIRSDNVILFYHGGSMTSEKKCEKAKEYLQPIKNALKDSNSIEFIADIKQDDQACFSDHSILLGYLSDQLLQICDSSRRYKFTIIFYSDKNAGPNVISSLLQMLPISRCSNFEITLSCIEEAMQLPVEAISDWLNRRKTDGRIPQELFMKIWLHKIQNVTEMCDHLLKKFKEANTPSLSYTLKLEQWLNAPSFVQTEETMLQNKKTNEEFSVHKKYNRIIEIKRAKKKVKN